jgi:transcription initiation factor IIE alpha subunit
VILHICDTCRNKFPVNELWPYGTMIVCNSCKAQLEYVDANKYFDELTEIRQSQADQEIQEAYELGKYLGDGTCQISPS